MKILLIRRRHLVLFAGALLAFALFWVVNAPASVAASVATRQLPIYCVDRDDNVISISFDAAWDTAKLIVFYQGMEKEERCFAVQFPDGRKATVINLNPDPDNDLPEFLREYALVIEVMKASLLSGNSCLKAAFAAWMAAQESAVLKHLKLPLEHMLDDANVWKELFEEYGFPKS